MLKRLKIKDFALIQNVDLTLESGFSVLSGETGSGKSILLDALGFLLGNRADNDFIKSGAKKCVIEGEFAIDSYNLQTVFEKFDWEYESPCIVRREINANGRSRAFVNDSPVLLGDLKEFGVRLVDVHAQNAIQILQSSTFYYDLIDGISGTQKERFSFESKYLSYKSLLSDYQNKKNEYESQKIALDYKRFQLEELDKIAPVIGEQELLEEELKTLGNAEEITSEIQKAINVLSEAEDSAVDLISSSEHGLNRVSGYFEKVAGLEERLGSLRIDLEDIIDELNAAKDGISMDSSRLEEVDERLSIIMQAVKKFVVKDGDQLCALKAQLEEEVQLVLNGNKALQELEEKLKSKEDELLKSGNALLKSREKGAKLLIKEVLGDLISLKMPHSELVIHQEKSSINRFGTQSLKFLFSANKGSTPKELVKVASGGELSRLMLVFKKILSRYQNLPTIVFDEIDTGVSGEVADKMAGLMRQMSKSMQLIAISHLPQTVGKADLHYKVWKEHGKESTESFIQKLNHEERLNVLAEMLSGAEITPAAIQNAKEILTSK